MAQSFVKPIQTLSGVFAAALVVAGCSPREELLPGQRFDPRELSEAREVMGQPSSETAVGVRVAGEAPQPVTREPAAAYLVAGQAVPIALPRARVNSSWPQAGGSAQHTIPHPMLGASLTRVWSADIGEGDSRRRRLGVEPAVASGRVLTMDVLGSLRSFSTDGHLLWQRNLTPATERPGSATGGGIAIAGQRAYVTTGFGALHAVDLATGAEIWVQDLGANPGAGPTVDGDTIYVTSRDGRGWALDATTGRILWQINAGEPGPVTTSGAAPAIAGRAAVFPFGSGEVIATLKRGGVQLWSAAVSGQRPGRAYGGIGDIASGPVVVGNRIYVANPAGRLAALDATSGERLWTAREGAWSQVSPVGGSLFLISDQNELVRLDARDGSTIWRASLPLFEEENVRRRTGIFAHYGPVLAGGRLIVVSTDGLMRQIDPASGRLLGTTRLPAPAAADPVVAGGTLYVMTADAQLHAFR